MLHFWINKRASERDCSMAIYVCNVFAHGLKLLEKVQGVMKNIQTKTATTIKYLASNVDWCKRHKKNYNNSAILMVVVAAAATATLYMICVVLLFMVSNLFIHNFTYGQHKYNLRVASSIWSDDILQPHTQW